MAISSACEALRPLTHAELYLSMAPIEIVNGKFQVTKFTMIYTNSMVAVFVFGLCAATVGRFSIATDAIMVTDNIGILARFVVQLEILVTAATYIVSSIDKRIKRMRHIELIHSLDKLDRTLIREFQVNMNYHKIVRKNKWMVVFFPMYFILLSLTYFMILVKDERLFTSLIAFFYTIAFVAAGLASYSAMNFADLLRIRFRLFQKLLDPTYLTRHYKDVGRRAKKLKILVEKYQDMFGVIKNVSDVYGLSLLMMHFHDFTMTTSQVYLLYWYWQSLEGADTAIYVMFVFWMFPTVWKSILLPLYMHLMMNEAEACIPLFTHADQHICVEDAKLMVEAFTMWNRHNKTRISNAGLFNSDMTLAFSICSAVASYLLVLIQFKMQEDGQTQE